MDSRDFGFGFDTFGWQSKREIAIGPATTNADGVEAQTSTSLQRLTSIEDYQLSLDINTEASPGISLSNTAANQ